MVTKLSGRADRSGSAGRIVPLLRPYRLQVSAVIVLIVVTSTIGIINPLLIQAVFNKALFVPGGPNLHLLWTCGTGCTRTWRLSRSPSSRAPRPARSSLGWPTTWAASRQ